MFKNRIKKGFRFFMDFETSGFKDKNHQILTGAVIVVNDLTGKVVHKEEYKVRLKKGVMPSVGAIATNKLKPWSEKYLSESITEFEFTNKMAELSSKFTIADNTGFVRPKFTAYNSDFDSFFLKVAMARSGRRFDDLFNKSISDPWKTAKGLVKDGLIKTPKGKRGNSSKLVDVATALNIKFSSDSHTAMADTEVLAKVYEKVMEMKTGKSPYSELSSAPELFEEGEVIRVKTNSQKSGIKDRHIKILKNLEEDGQIVALDLDDIRANKGFKDSAVRTFNYHTIISEEMPNENDIHELEVYHREFKAEIEDLVKDKDIKKKDEDIEFDPAVSDFELIEAIESGIHSKEFNLEDIENILIQQSKSPLTISALKTKAHQLSIAKGREGIKELGPMRTWEKFEEVKNDFVEYANNMDPEKMTENDWSVIEYFDWVQKNEPNEFKNEKFAKLHDLHQKFLMADGDMTNSIVVETTPESSSKTVKYGNYQRCVVCGRKLRSKKSSISGIGPECSGKV